VLAYDDTIYLKRKKSIIDGLELTYGKRALIAATMTITLPSITKAVKDVWMNSFVVKVDLNLNHIAHSPPILSINPVWSHAQHRIFGKY
jgi:hypothetical protein